MMQANTGVRFETKDPLLSQLVKQAEEKCRLNIKNFGGDPVLVEGGGYEKIWLETQPMGGAMYASRDFATGLNNSLMFMRHQRADGRIPGSIAVIDGKVVPQFNKFQGFCFPEPALDLYYLGGKDAEYLAQLAKTLEVFDAYLWRVRDSDGDGCLETWCKYDTGEDHAMRYADAPDPWEEETPPQGCTAVPIASMDVMSYSYACRETLAEIARISGDAEAQAQWAAKAKAVQDKMVSYLWDDARGAMFDRDKNHNQMPTLIHNTLRCMYWHSLPDALAERFVKEHLLNPQEFWTKMPLPSVAANDPLFRNVTTNNWSGQAEALTYQRAIRALENYGMYELIPQLGQKLMQAIGPQCRFVQQYDPFTGEPSVICEPGQPPQDAYGPAMLSVLEYTARMLLMKGVQHLTIREVTLTRSAFWTVHMVGCQDVLIDGIRILNNLKMVNCDGIDPDHCRNVRINNCHIESADDCIVFKTTEKNAYLGPCENIVVSNCTLTSTSAAIKFGTESVSDFRNITVTNCVISRTNRGISLMLRDGGNIENVTFANLHINTRMFSDQWWGEAEAICVTAVDRKQGNRAGHIRNVHFENINCSGENGIFLHGSEGNSLEDISFRHIRVDIRKQTAWPIDHWDLRPSEVPGMIPGKVNGFTCVHGKSIRCEDVVIRKDSSMDPWFDQDFCWQDTENVTVVK